MQLTHRIDNVYAAHPELRDHRIGSIPGSTVHSAIP